MEKLDRDAIFAYVKKIYRVDPDYPFHKDFDSAAMRHKDSNKWFALVMKVRRDKLGDDSDELVDIITMKSEPMLIDSLVMKDGFHRAYHMNKKQWVSVELNGRVSEEEIRNLIDLSFDMTDRKSKK